MIDIAEAAQTLKRKRERRRAALQKRLESAQQDASRIIAFIAAKYSPSRILQWGSLVRTERFCEISDIDIAIEGLSQQEDLSALRNDVESMTELVLDIVMMENLERGRADLIRRFGRVTWEREPNGRI